MSINFEKERKKDIIIGIIKTLLGIMFFPFIFIGGIFGVFLLFISGLAIGTGLIQIENAGYHDTANCSCNECGNMRTRHFWTPIKK